jgi:phosphatidylserine/phosphatidylglycerophosphate/cardiolipin synthase-like enzyme
MIPWRTLAALIPAVLLAGCETLGLGGPRPPLTDAALARIASAPLLEASEARVITDNDQAFLSKVKLVEGARHSIDMAYYIFADDYSSSYLARALIDAARRGVAVRLLVDYNTNYKRLDWYSTMEKLGNEGKGSLRVRFYNRPTRNIIEDAVYMTMGCGKDGAARRPAADCSQEKFAAIDKLFADERIDGRPAAARNISNLNIGASGLFLSGLYAKRPDIMATAMEQGQGLDPSKFGQGASAASAQDKENLKKLAKTYWESRTGAPFQRLQSKAVLYFAFSVYGQKLDPIYDTFTSLVPAERKMTPQEIQDWDHITDFTHHKLLLVDDAELQMGGRNVEDSYHMHPNPLTEKYVFMDTDLRASLAHGGKEVARTFDALWGFDTMVATLAEVREHAPNELVANLDAYKQAQEACGATPQKPAPAACVDQGFEARAKTLAQRVAARAADMEHRAAIYRTRYLPHIPTPGGPSFEVDKGAVLAYLENLPFDKALPPAERRRTYGAPVGEEAASGKYIHEAWLDALADVCRGASAQDPKRVILHSAYFFPPANMTYALSRMVNGALDCSHVTVTVLTNSVQTTDLNIVNLVARHALKAFTEYYQQHSDPRRRAQFEYYEYRAPRSGPNLSLHTKVSVLGDDLIVGSANADVRSYMMDSNNGMFIRNAPKLHAAYVGFVQKILNDTHRAWSLNDYFATTPRAVMMQEDLADFRKLLAKYHADRHLDQAQQQRLEERFTEMLDAAYTLTRESISGESSASQRRRAQDRFNELFKPI